MKKIQLLLPALVLLSFTGTKNPITDQERKTAIDLLSQTEQGVLDAVKGLSDAQLNFKAAPDRWSVEDNAKHIAESEMSLWQMVENQLKQPANPEKRSDIKVTDDQVVQMVENRTRKVKTLPNLEPQNTPFKTLDEALQSFRENREKLINYVKTTDDDLRGHVLTLPYGSFDAYQMILFIAAHSNRHTQQIGEVKADPGFPKN
ncbi:MAG TPA: DinB family protein [Chitinophagaceae bacterium]|nr:DinB family protein [Chitinophagaceae bacterium]